MGDPTQTTVMDRGWTFAFARSLALAQAAGQRGNWFAPGYSTESKFEEMPNNGRCECGEGYFVSDVYHYHSLVGGLWHTRQLCISVEVQHE